MELLPLLARRLLGLVVYFAAYMAAWPSCISIVNLVDDLWLYFRGRGIETILFWWVLISGQHSERQVGWMEAGGRAGKEIFCQNITKCELGRFSLRGSQIICIHTTLSFICII